MATEHGAADAAQEPTEGPRPLKVKKKAGVGVRLGVLGQALRMVRSSERPWLLPMVGLLMVLGLVLSGLQAIEYVAPFIYAIF